MADIVADEDNPMLLHSKPKEDNAIDLYGRNIPIDPSKIPLVKTTPVDSVCDKLAQVVAPNPDPHFHAKITVDTLNENTKSWLGHVAAFFGFSGTF